MSKLDKCLSFGESSGIQLSEFSLFHRDAWRLCSTDSGSYNGMAVIQIGDTGTVLRHAEIGRRSHVGSIKGRSHNVDRVIRQDVVP